MINKVKIGDKMAINKRRSIKGTLDNKNVQKSLVFIITFIILFAISSINVIPKKYDFKAGDIAPADIKASRDFVDENATNKKLEEAVSKVSPKYDRNELVLKNAQEGINNYFAKAIEIKAMAVDENTKIEKLKGETKLNLSKEDYLSTLRLGDEDLKTLSKKITEVLNRILQNEIREENIEDLRKAQEDLRFYIRNSPMPMSKAASELAENIAINFIKPNAKLNVTETEELKKEAKKQVEPVVIKKNQNIVLKGEVITEEHIYLLDKGGLLHKNITADITIYLGVAILILTVEMLIAAYLYKFRKEIFKSNGKLLIIAIVLVIMAVFTTGTNMISQYLMPTGLIVILMALIFDPYVALMVSIPAVFIVTCVVNFNYSAILLYIIGSVSGLLFTFNAHQRNNVLFSGAATGVLSGIIIFSVSLINNIDVKQGIVNSLMGFGGGILSAILAIGILPIFEQYFDIITPIKLLELSNPNQPLLKKLLFEAPGTYHHSILVGNLAEAAAEEVGADSLLARVGAYYHDIGKIKRPYFFKENQITNDNPHDKITPKLSTLIITSHVKDGLELADKYKLPRAIKDIIEQHHGTTLVKYFYVMAVKDEKGEVEDKEFRYEGPNPISKEIAIVMLADSVEAAVRSLNNPNIPAIETMINKIINEKVEDGQLDNCDLTLKDLERIKKSFVNVLVGIFHNRIEYPELTDLPKEKES